MAKVPKFDAWRLRSALIDYETHRNAFLETAEGAALLEQFAEHLAPSIVSIMRDRWGKWGYDIEAADVAHLTLVNLLGDPDHEREDEKLPIRYVIEAEDPWGYLWRSAFRWIRAESGIRGHGIENEEWLPEPEPATSELDLTPLAEVVRLTYVELSARTPEHHHRELLELLSWLAANPPQRLSYEGADCAAAHRQAPGMSVDQVSAVMNIAWGGRPRQAATSLMGQYLLDPKFEPAQSPTHIRALIYFKNAFRAAEVQSRMLTDWT